MILRRFLIADCIAGATAGLAAATLSDILKVPLSVPIDRCNMLDLACWRCRC